MLKVARENPLQSLSEKELQLDETPITSYPRPVPAKAWVRFGSIPVHMDCWIHRTTSSAAGISFRIRDKTFRCWVWGNAVSVHTLEGEQRHAEPSAEPIVRGRGGWVR